MKIVYHFDSSTGFGDNIRGLISILQINKKIPFDLIIDFSRHSFSDFFIRSSETIDTQTEILHYISSETPSNEFLINKINELSQTYEVIGITTNNYPILEEIDNEMKRILEKILRLKPEIEEYLTHKLSELPEKYHLFHYRLGDKILNQIDNNQTCNNELFIQNFIENRKEKENIVVISDSLSLKQELFDLYQNKGVYVFLNTPYHTNKKGCIDTLVDFCLIRNATSVHCYTCYEWVSNFILWSSIMYDVPLFEIESETKIISI